MFQLFGRMSQFSRRRQIAAAFPTVQTTSNGSTATTATADATLPTGITAGDRLIMFVTVGGNMSTPSGWTLLVNASSIPQVSVFHKVADGSEGSVVSLTSVNAQAKRYVIYRITNYNGAPFGAGAQSGVNGAPDPPNLAAPAGTYKILWFAAGASLTVNALPTNYGSGLSASSLMVGTRQLEAASEDPGAFGVSSNALWSAATVGLRGL